LVSSSGLE
jgi:hypothetical protein